MSNQPKEKQLTIDLPRALFEEATVIREITGISIAALVKDGLHIAIATRKARLHASLIDKETLETLCENELNTGVSLANQVSRAVKYWFRSKEINKN